MQDYLVKDFLRRCLNPDPESRFEAKEAKNHPWFLTR